MANHKREYKDREIFVMNQAGKMLNGFDQMLGHLQICFTDMTQEEIQATVQQLLNFIHQINERGKILEQYKVNAPRARDLLERNSRVHRIIASSYGGFRFQLLPSPPSDTNELHLLPSPPSHTNEPNQ
jgi:hypothetical protein